MIDEKLIHFFLIFFSLYLLALKFNVSKKKVVLFLFFMFKIYSEIV